MHPEHDGVLSELRQIDTTGFNPVAIVVNILVIQNKSLSHFTCRLRGKNEERKSRKKIGSPPCVSICRKVRQFLTQHKTAIFKGFNSGAFLHKHIERWAEEI
jgi:hypothetical protein